MTLEEFYKEDQRNTYFMKKPFDKLTFSDVIQKMLGSLFHGPLSDYVESVYGA